MTYPQMYPFHVHVSLEGNEVVAHVDVDDGAGSTHEYREAITAEDKGGEFSSTFHAAAVRAVKRAAYYAGARYDADSEKGDVPPETHKRRPLGFVS